MMRLYKVGPWIDHDGGGCPFNLLPGNDVPWVQCLHPGGKEPGPPFEADVLNWVNRTSALYPPEPHHSNIVRYRVVQFPPKYSTTFVNELGNEIEIILEYNPKASNFSDGVQLSIAGPRSTNENYITLAEATEIHRALGVFLSWPTGGSCG
jgi:hypothetical protein